jgi:hypothetical protein
LLWALAGAVVLIALFAFGATVQNLGDVKKSEAATTAPKPVASKLPGFGDKVSDGTLGFVVSKVDCGRTSIGKEHLKTTAEGQFCVVSVRVHNLDTKSRLFSSRLQKAYAADGTKYTDDALADFYANDNSQTFLQSIAPGATVLGKIVFDVPKGVRLTGIELHDSLFSGGVRVELA